MKFILYLCHSLSLIFTQYFFATKSSRLPPQNKIQAIKQKY